VSRKNEEARMILPKGWNYITVLDFGVGKVFQYKLPKKRPFEDINFENYITNKGHRLNDIEWMVHDSSEIITN